MIKKLVQLIIRQVLKAENTQKLALVSLSDISLLSIYIIIPYLSYFKHLLQIILELLCYSCVILEFIFGFHKCTSVDALSINNSCEKRDHACFISLPT